MVKLSETAHLSVLIVGLRTNGDKHVPQLLLKFLMPAGKSTTFFVLCHTWLKKILDLKKYLNTGEGYRSVLEVPVPKVHIPNSNSGSSTTH